MQFENPIAIFKTVVIGVRKENLFRATGFGDGRFL